MTRSPVMETRTKSTAVPDDDTLIGGLGADVLTCGAGRDVFIAEHILPVQRLMILIKTLSRIKAPAVTRVFSQ
ncbi:hypothetical protein EMGBS3_08750 [Anaerolineaceae bacterium]|nr:hypothetical protein EMGBS3_08750 [Anaerolineaceae bacterium]